MEGRYAYGSRTEGRSAYRSSVSKSKKCLECFKNRNFFKVIAIDDPVIRRLASEDKPTVFATVQSWLH